MRLWDPPLNEGQMPTVGCQLGLDPLTHSESHSP